MGTLLKIECPLSAEEVQQILNACHISDRDWIKSNREALRRLQKFLKANGWETS